jgi:hypothetical protein
MTHKINKENKGGTRKENHQTRHLTVGPDKGETQHWRQQTDTNPPKRKRREDLPPLGHLTLPQKHTRNHIFKSRVKATHTDTATGKTGQGPTTGTPRASLEAMAMHAPMLTAPTTTATTTK